MNIKQYAALFSALADETRLRLLALMRREEVCVCFLQEALGVSQPKISRHLAHLRAGGLAATRREGKWIHYRLARVGKEQSAVLSAALDQIAKTPMAREDAKRLCEAQRPSRHGEPQSKAITCCEAEERHA